MVGALRHQKYEKVHNKRCHKSQSCESVRFKSFDCLLQGNGSDSASQLAIIISRPAAHQRPGAKVVRAACGNFCKPFKGTFNWSNQGRAVPAPTSPVRQDTRCRQIHVQTALTPSLCQKWTI